MSAGPTGLVVTVAVLPLEPSVRAAVAEVYTDALGGSMDDWLGHLEASLGSECLLAWSDGLLVGFKWSTMRRPDEIHSTLGCVLGSHRRRGIARLLLEHQHRRIRARGLKRVTTNTLADNVPMLLLNLTMGFDVVGLQAASPAPKVLLLRTLEDGQGERQTSKRLTLSDEWRVEEFAVRPPDVVRRHIAFLYAEVFNEPFDAFFGFLDDAPTGRCWVVRHEGRVVGFKWGTARSPREFHSHVGAVDPAFRRRGIARALLQSMRTWCAGRYTRLSTATFNRFRGMLILNLREGFRIDGLVQQSDQPMLLLSMAPDEQSVASAVSTG